MHEHGSPPRARQDGLLEEAAGEELLIYDQSSHIAHCLSPIAACVWRHCDGERDVSELAGLAGVSESLVADALYELREKDLLAAEPQQMQSASPGISRREVIVRGVRVGAAAAAAPLIVSATAATPAMASSGKASCTKTGVKTDSCCGCNNDVCHTAKSEKACKEVCEKEGSTAILWQPEEYECTV